MSGCAIYRTVQRWVLVPAIADRDGDDHRPAPRQPRHDFATKFNAFHGGTGITTAACDGRGGQGRLSPARFNLGHTLIGSRCSAAYVPYTMYSAQGLLGEVKQRLAACRRLFMAFFMPGAFVALVMLALPCAAA